MDVGVTGSKSCVLSYTNRVELLTESGSIGSLKVTLKAVVFNGIVSPFVKLTTTTAGVVSAPP
jgi:hypothetical protein